MTRDRLNIGNEFEDFWQVVEIFHFGSLQDIYY
jgi:hypothetical protein